MASDSNAPPTSGPERLVYTAAGRGNRPVMWAALWLLGVGFVIGFTVPITSIDCVRSEGTIRCVLSQGAAMRPEPETLALPPFTRARELAGGHVVMSSPGTDGVATEETLRLEPRLARAVLRIAASSSEHDVHASVGWARVGLLFAIAPIVLLAFEMLRFTTRVVVQIDRTAGEVRLRRGRAAGGTSRLALGDVRDVRVETASGKEKGMERVVIVLKDGASQPVFDLHMPGTHHRAFAETLRAKLRRKNPERSARSG